MFSHTLIHCVRVKAEVLSLSLNCKHELRPKACSQTERLCILRLRSLTGETVFHENWLVSFGIDVRCIYVADPPKVLRKTTFHSHFLELDFSALLLCVYAKKLPTKSYKPRSYQKVKGHECGLKVYLDTTYFLWPFFSQISAPPKKSESHFKVLHPKCHCEPITPLSYLP